MELNNKLSLKDRKAISNGVINTGDLPKYSLGKSNINFLPIDYSTDYVTTKEEALGLGKNGQKTGLKSQMVGPQAEASLKD